MGTGNKNESSAEDSAVMIENRLKQAETANAPPQFQRSLKPSLKHNSDTSDISIGIKSAPGIVQPEDVIVFAFTITNNGPAAAEDVFITIARPFGLSFVQVCICGDTFEPWPGSCIIGRMETGRSLEIILKGTVDIDMDGQFRLTAHVNAKPHIGHNMAAVKVTVIPPEAQTLCTTDSATKNRPWACSGGR